VMIAILNRVLFKPIAAIISNREQENAKNAADVAEMQRAIEDGNRRYRDTLREARTGGYKLIEEYRTEGLRERAARLEALKTEIDERVARERSLIELQAKDARRDLDTVTLASSIRDQILKGTANIERGN
ncbi:MAG TPA: ATP synthase F0 subunit B, partial [Candidatus Binatia bacterium]|nr:ATP synthase F0 subunit B [Candidatus Binatia bacterium]